MLVYTPITNLLQLMVDDPQYSHIDGMLYYHFDSWIQPMGYTDMDFDRIWYLDNPSDGGPPFRCMRKPEEWDPNWMWFHEGRHEDAKKASRIVASYLEGYNMDSEEFCIG